MLLKLPELVVNAHSIGSDGRLYRKGKLVSTFSGWRQVSHCFGSSFDAASVAFSIHYGFLPNVLPRFLDGNVTNYHKENLSLSRRGSRNPAKEHADNIAKCLQQLEYWQLTPSEYKPISSSAYVDRGDPEPGKMWYSYRGKYLQIPLPKGIWDDARARAKLVFDAASRSEASNKAQ